MACRVHLVLEPPAKRLRKGDNFVDKIYWDVRPSRFTRVQLDSVFSFDQVAYSTDDGRSCGAHEGRSVERALYDGLAE